MRGGRRWEGREIGEEESREEVKIMRGGGVGGGG